MPQLLKLSMRVLARVNTLHFSPFKLPLPRLGPQENNCRLISSHLYYHLVVSLLFALGLELSQEFSPGCSSISCTTMDTPLVFFVPFVLWCSRWPLSVLIATHGPAFTPSTPTFLRFNHYISTVASCRYVRLINNCYDFFIHHVPGSHRYGVHNKDSGTLFSRPARDLIITTRLPLPNAFRSSFTRGRF